MRRIFAKTNVGDDEELWEALAQETDGGNDGSFWIIGGCSKSILYAGRKWDTKEYDGAEALSDERFEEGDDFVDTPAVLAWERWDEGFFVIIVRNEEGEDQH
jgi:hypothetical protein